MSSKNAIFKGFILPDGTIAQNGTQHNDIAMDYICNNNMQDQYNKSKYKDLSDFFVYELRAIKVGCSIGGNSKVITFIAEEMNREQWQQIKNYNNMGYKLDML